MKKERKSTESPSASGTGTDEGGRQRVQVVVRCRPLNKREKEEGTASILSCNAETKEVKVGIKNRPKTFTFDKVYGQFSKQAEIYEQTVAPIIDEVLQGFNCTVFAYGQTGTGKTHTMEGDLKDNEHAGIIPRSVRGIFEHLQSLDNAEYSVRVSYLEVYNEELQDLLRPQADKKIRICDDARNGVSCQNLEEVMVGDCAEIFGVLETAVANRTVAATLCNERSSRSHSIFTLKIHIKETTAEGEDLIKVGKLNLVDLAGSECVGKSGAKDVRAREASNINKSLLTLGRVITALVELRGHVPYRDSKLTRLLQESLGGKAKTCVIATVTPCSDSIEETLSTLEYMHSAKRIKNKPQANQRMTKRSLIKEYTEDIEKLRSLLTAARDKNGVFLPQAQFEGMETQITGQTAQILELEQALVSKETEMAEVCTVFEGVKGELKDAKKEITTLSTDLCSTKSNLESTTVALSAAEEEVEETKAIVSEQVATETLLTEQAHSTRQELVQTSNEVSGLFAKVDRKQQVEDKNQAAVTKLSRECDAQVTALSSELERYERGQQQQAEAVVQSVRSMALLHASSTVQLSSALEALVKVSSESAFSPNETVQTYCSDAQEKIGGLASSVEAHTAERIASMQSSTNSVTCAVTLLRGQLVAQQQAIEAWAEKLSADLEHQRSGARTFAEQQRAGLSALGGIVSNGAETVQGLLVDKEGSLEHTLRKSADKAKQEQQEQLKKLNADISNLLGAFAAQQTQSLASSVDAASDLAVRVASVVGDMDRAVDTKTKNMVTDFKHQETGADEGHHASVGSTKKIIQTRAADAEATNNTLTQLVEQSTTAADEFIQADGKWSTEFVAQTAEADQAAETFAASMKAELEAAAKLGADIAKQTTISMMEAEEVTAAAVTGIADGTSTFIRDDARVGVNNLRQKVRAFAGEDFGTDISTGGTPSLRTIPVIGKFAVTEAHEIITKKHRRSKRGLAFSSPSATTSISVSTLQSTEQASDSEPSLEEVEGTVGTDAELGEIHEEPSPPRLQQNTGIATAATTAVTPPPKQNQNLMTTTTAATPPPKQKPKPATATTASTTYPKQKPILVRATSDSSISIAAAVFDPKKMKVSDLRVELKARGLDQTGLKPVLLKRLQKAMGEDGPTAPSTPVVNFDLGGRGTPRRSSVASSIPTPRTAGRRSKSTLAQMPLAESTNSPHH
jgi:kinesin family protein 11